MPRNLEFWYALSPHFRVLTGIAVTSLMLMFCWWGLIIPIKTDQLALEAKRITQQRTVLARWQTLMKLKPPANPEPITKENNEPFSPLAFQSSGRQLIRWQPTVAGGEMVLEVQWEQVPQTFLYLAERDMRAGEFSLVMKDSVLHLTLQLERDDGG